MKGQKMKSRMKVLRIKEDFWEVIEEEAKKQGITTSELIKTILIHSLKGIE